MTQTGQNRRQGPRQPQLTPKKRDKVDTSLVALCYWLIAQRLVEDAEAHGELDCPDPAVHPDRQLRDDDQREDGGALGRVPDPPGRAEQGGRS